MSGRLCALLVLAGAVYAIALPGPFQFDDFATVAIDPGARSASAWWADLGQHVRPLTKLTFVLSHQLGVALDHIPAGHRVVNIVIHLLTIAALFSLGRQLAETHSPGLDRRQAAAAALAAAALFGLHPLATEAVSYLSGRSMALGTLLATLSLLAYIRWRTTQRIIWQALALAAFGAAAFAREVAIFTPLLWLAWDLLRPPQIVTARIAPARKPFIAAAFVLSACLGLWMLVHPRYSALLEVSRGIAAANLDAPSLTLAFDYFASALALLRYPTIDPSLPFTSMGPASHLTATALLFALVAAAWWLRRRNPGVTFAAAWTGIWLLPVYAFPLRLDTVAERHFYPAIWGVALICCLVLVRWSSGLPRRLALSSAAGVMVLCLLVAVTLTRNADYRSEIALWEAARRSTPSNLRALNNLGVAYMEAGRWEDAQAVLARASALDPGNANVFDNLLFAEQRERGPAIWVRNAR